MLGRVGVTVTIFAFLLSRVDLSSYGHTLGKAFGYWFISAFLMYALPLVTSAFKWGHLLRALRVFIATTILLKLYVMGFFISSFLPGVVGGDVVRCYMIGPDIGGRLKVAATVVLERVTGVVALVVMCLLALLWNPAHLVTLPIVVMLGGISVALCGGLTMALSRRLALGLMYRVRHLRIRRVVRPLYELHFTIYNFPRKSLVVALGYSCVFYLTGSVAFLMICRAFGVHLSFAEAASVQVLRSLLILIPISIGGLGLSQAGDVYLLGIWGIDGAPALGISIARQLINYSYALMGGVLFVQWRGHSRDPADLDLEYKKISHNIP